jgi:ribonucleoside-diphosphate reductase alpha chain
MFEGEGGSEEYNGIQIATSRDKNLTEQAKMLLVGYYQKGNEDSPQKAFARASVAYCGGDMELAQRIYDYASKGWFMFSSPILSNAPEQGKDHKGLPISCFLTYVPDSLEGLIEHSAELRWLSVKGGGVGGHWSDVRAVSQISPGLIPFLKTVDSDMNAYRQGVTRKGSYAAYLDIDHPDILEFVNMRMPSGGDPNRKCLNLHNAVNITDAFMKATEAGEDWDLLDPNDGSIRSTLPARELWERLLETRFRTGEPYLNFIDTANEKLPKALKKKGLTIKGSNLCNEIHLPTNEDRTAVCCLSSVNLEHFTEWKGTGMVRDLTEFLDNVLTAFIVEAPDTLRKATNSAFRERSIGIGAMGFHGLLQKNNIAWESASAVSLNRYMFKHIKDEAVKASQELADSRGCPYDMEGTGMRHAHLLAVAPNANSSIITGATPSIEPVKSNAYTHRTRAGAHLIKNRHLEKLLRHRGENTEEVWQSILHADGSVQHLDFLDEHEKEVFKTAFELDQRWVVDHASYRQEYICQGQSVNLFFPSGSNKADVNGVHIRAWAKGLKGLYYLRTESSKAAEKVSLKVERDALKEYQEECLACQG